MLFSYHYTIYVITVTIFKMALFDGALDFCGFDGSLGSVLGFPSRGGFAGGVGCGEFVFEVEVGGGDDDGGDDDVSDSLVVFLRLLLFLG
jgi:hypothetical protein